MSTKLVSMNVGIQLTLLVDGKQKRVTWSAVCPSKIVEQPIEAIQLLCDFLNDNFDGIHYVAYEPSHDNTVSIAKPKRIKAPKRVSQAEFNKRIKELQP